ncbi:DUF4926 domain-containing protein [Pseudanabaena sp. FACHB-1277]|uniref:DUF4926 domain-containing protein n=1 Tax=Pseudanabaena cinerea FACHB-1277 TaxID=2949581 RepID=A0A926UX43_9CYAN|nr:DUF4926 domain-containing protein [Pseudanabaena cinerea]MBD2151645.1 DUF4926 domain-containing protein [Pseudanabaena cinerea FACHB-1277]
MIKPELLDIVEILVNLPDHKQFVGDQGTIVECYDDDNFEVEFVNESGETTALCALSSKQFIVVWQISTKQWVTPTDKIAAIFSNLSDTKRQEVLDFARFIYQRA